MTQGTESFWNNNSACDIQRFDRHSGLPNGADAFFLNKRSAFANGKFFIKSYDNHRKLLHFVINTGIIVTYLIFWGFICHVWKLFCRNCPCKAEKPTIMG